MALVKRADATRTLLDQAQVMARKTEQPFSYNALFILARTAHLLKDSDAAEQFYRLAIQDALKLQSGQKMIQSLGGLIDLFDENEQHDKTVKLCRKFLKMESGEAIDRLKPAVLECMIQSLTRQNKIDEAMKLVDEMVQAEGEDAGWWALQLKGWVQREAEHLEDAAKTYETVVERIGKDEKLSKEEKSTFAQRARYILSEVYTELNQVEKAVEHLQALLHDEPNDPTFNNDLGYIWADHDMNLAEAEKHIRKALRADRKRRKADTELAPEDDKDSAAFLDSLGWVLFKQKKYEQAKKYLLKATSDPEGQEVETLLHLGMVHQALGEMDEARQVFQEAIEAAGSGKRDQRLKVTVQDQLQMLDD
jgi:pentatricopeptide repeat protein